MARNVYEAHRNLKLACAHVRYAMQDGASWEDVLAAVQQGFSGEMYEIPDEVLPAEVKALRARRAAEDAEIAARRKAREEMPVELSPAVAAFARSAGIR